MLIQARRAGIDDGVLTELRRKYQERGDPNPEFRAYVVGHEGVTTPYKVNEQTGESKASILNWGRHAIQALSSALSVGTKFFIGHGNGTNSHAGRKPVGEVVSSFVENINSKLHSIVIGYFPNKEEVKDMDFCSAEANVQFDHIPIFNTPTGVQEVGDVNMASGIALGSLDEGTPAFPGAALLQTVQCFDSSTDPNTGTSETDTQESSMADEVFTTDKVKDGVKALNMSPHQLFETEDILDSIKMGKFKVSPSSLFSMDQLRQDTEFKSYFEQSDTDSKALKTSVKKVETLENEKKEMSVTHLTATEKHRLTEMAGVQRKDGKLTEKQEQFIVNQYKANPDVPMDDTAMTKFITDQKVAFTEQAKFWGVEDAGDGDSKENKGDGNNNADSTDENANKQGANQVPEDRKRGGTGDDKAEEAAMDFFLNRKPAEKAA